MSSNRSDISVKHRGRSAPVDWRRALAFLSAALATASLAATTGYQYDALGRLIEVTHDNGNVTSYTLDAAGNRSKVDELLAQASPASMTVPSTSNTGSYTVSWTAGGTVTSYELFEATASNFSTQTRIYLGAGTSVSISGHGNGTFYYRVRGCTGSACTAYRTGGNGVVITLPPSAPASISVPSTNTSGSIAVSWGAATGNVTTYELWEATNSGFTGETRVYNALPRSALITGHQNGSYYFRARACNGAICGSYATGANATVVSNIAPPAPTGLTTNQNSQCSWTANWTASVGATSYTIRDWSGNYQYSFSAPATSTVYSFCGAPGYTGISTDYRPRWLKACNGTSCSSQVNFP